MRTDTEIMGPVGQLHVDDGGSGGLPVVFIHSFGGSTAHWTEQLEHVRGSRRAVAFDLPGHGGTDARVHHERQVLSRLEGFRETEATPPHCHIDHLPTGEPCLIRDDHPEIHNRSHRPPWFSPEYLRFLFGQLGYCSFHGEFLLRSVHPIYEWGSNSHAGRIFLSRTHKFARL
jgi:pimeloyl-ACP methyl ester carboxylesterase